MPKDQYAPIFSGFSRGRSRNFSSRELQVMLRQLELRKVFDTSFGETKKKPKLGKAHEPSIG